MLDIRWAAEYDRTIITYPEHGRENQVFYVNQDHTLGSIAFEDMVLGFKETTPASGAQLYSAVKTGASNQKFNIIPYTKSRDK